MQAMDCFLSDFLLSFALLHVVKCADGTYMALFCGLFKAMAGFGGILGYVFAVHVADAQVELRAGVS